MLEEIGIPYDHVPVRPYTDSRSAEYLRINPNGHIPSLEDDGFVVWESLAINMYLARTMLGSRYGRQACEIMRGSVNGVYGRPMRSSLVS
jgi:glutathione S-transferase